MKLSQGIDVLGGCIYTEEKLKVIEEVIINTGKNNKQEHVREKYY